jgi:SAM-dependent methyltransferase
MRLKKQVVTDSLAYQQYLDTQFNRTWCKRYAPLPIHTKILVEKIIEFTDIAHCAVLCVGCRNTAEIDYFWSKGAMKVIGIDLYSKSKDILVMDMHQMNFPENSFDVVFCSHSLEHAYNTQQAISQIVRAARPGALLAIEVPIQYETRGADRVDFESLLGLQEAFKPYISKVLWGEEQVPNTPSNPYDIAIARTILLV